MVRPFVWRDVSGTVGGGGSNGRWTVVSSDSKPVCHKYGNDDKCRFLFPHEIVESSYFNQDSNSVVLKCLDSMVNYFNRYILVYCHHNHDLKCILSGKAAKAAMCYITDYITKMDMKTYQMLSLLSRAETMC